MQQYYKAKSRWEYMPVAGFTKAFQQTHMAQQAAAQLQQPYVAPNAKCNEALIQHRYALTGTHFVHSLTNVLQNRIILHSRTTHMCPHW